MENDTHKFAWKEYEQANFIRIELTYRNVKVGHIDCDFRSVNAKTSICMLIMCDIDTRYKHTSFVIVGAYHKINDERDIWNNKKQNKAFLKRKVLKANIRSKIDLFIESLSRIDKSKSSNKYANFL